MKKILLTLLLLFTGVAASSARNDDPNDIESTLFDYLYERGYNPAYDEDDDIVFTKDDLICYAICSSNETFSLIEFRIIFDSEKSFDELLRVANTLNREKYLCKCTVEPGRFQISIEFATSSVAQAILQTERALFWMSVCIESLNGKI